MKIKVKVYVAYKKGVLDPQGKAILNSLHSLGYKEVEEVRAGKYFELTIDDSNLSKEEIDKKIKEMAEKVLSNPIMESFSYEFV